MKLLLFLFTAFFYINCFSQNIEKEYTVEYQHFYDTKYPTIMPAVLYIKNGITIYQQKKAQATEWKEGSNQSNIRPTFSRLNPIEDDYMKIDHIRKELLAFEVLSDGMLISDNYPEINWSITTETKVIANQQCIKAKSTYRGRDWEAWFATGIALPYGPWKFHGLPGLILEAKSADGKFLIKAIKIEEISNEIFAVDFNSLRETRNSKPITYKQFLADQDEYFENVGKKMESEGMKVIFETPPRSGYELKYEWEK